MAFREKLAQALAESGGIPPVALARLLLQYPDEVGTALRQAGQGATFGFMDEGQDAIGAALASALTDESFSDLYKEARANSQERLARDFDESPFLSVGAQIVGGIPLGATKAAAGAANWIRNSGSTLGAMGKGSLVGAGYGALAGLGAAGDTAAERASGAATGGALGFGLGGITGPLARTPQQAERVNPEAIAKRVVKGGDFANEAERAVARDIAMRSDISQRLPEIERTLAAAQQQGISLTLPEAIARSADDSLLAQQGILTQKPSSAGVMNDLYNARSGTLDTDGQIVNRLRLMAQELAPGVSTYDEAANAVNARAGQAVRDITRQLSEEAAPLYQSAYTKGLAPDAEIFADPLIQQTLQSVRGNPVYQSGFKNLGPQGQVGIEELDLVQRALRDSAENASMHKRRYEASLIGDARDRLLQVADEVAPEFAQARAVYSGNPDSLRMREAAGALADIDPLQGAKSVETALYGGTPARAQQAAALLGEEAPKAAAMRLYGAMDTARGQATTLANRIAPDARSREIFNAYAGVPDYIDDTLRVIRQAQLSDRFRNNSVTAPMQEAGRRLSGGAMNAVDTAVDLASGNNMGLIRKVAQRFGKQDDPAFYSDMAQIFTTPRGAEIMRAAAAGQQQAIAELQNSVPALRQASGALLQSGLAPVRPAISLMAQPSEPQMTPIPGSNAQRIQEMDAFLAGSNPRMQEMENYLNSVKR